MQVAASISHNTTSPVQTGPAGFVQVASDIDDERVVRNVGFGGSGAGGSVDDSYRGEARTVFARSAQTGALESVRLHLSALVEGVSRRREPNAFGTLYYESVDELSLMQPSRFTRTLTPEAGRATVYSGSAALSGVFWPTNRVQVSPGLRFDMERAADARDNDARARDIFGIATANEPGGFGVSPRLSLYVLSTPGQVRRGAMTAIYDGPAWWHVAPPASWTITVGRYRSTLRPDFIASAGSSTFSAIDCVGEQVPEMSALNWSDVSSIPVACTTGGGLSATLPGVRAISEEYSPVSTWSASIAREQVLRPVGTAIKVTAMHNRSTNVPSAVDLNQAGIPQFRDAEGRAVFASVGDIGETALIPFSATRREQSFGRVIETRSTGTSDVSMLNVRLTPVFRFQEKVRGTVVFDYWLRRGGHTADPSDVANPSGASQTRYPLAMPQHMLQFQIGKKFGDVVVTGRLSFNSGSRFTPIVDRDVNGDGFRNDIAFVSSSNSSALSQLYDTLSPSARSCLESQQLQFAEPYSCTGGWSMGSNLRVIYAAPLRWGDRNISLNLNVANPLAAMDQLLHGSDRLRGWGSAAVVDPVLLAATSFNRDEKRFAYAVNPRFGQSSPARGGLWSPYRISLNVSIDLADPIPVQELHEMLGVRRGGVREPAPESTVLDRLRGEYLSNPYDALLSRRDSLALTRNQDDSLRVAEDAYQARAMVVVKDLAHDLATTMRGARGARLVEHRDRQVAILARMAEEQWALIGTILREDQIRKLSQNSQNAIARAKATSPNAQRAG
jgi:hypothetical protein